MTTRGSFVPGLLLAGLFVLLPSSPARAAAFAMSDITGSNFIISTPLGSFAEFTALSAAFNTLGEDDSDIDGPGAPPVVATSSVTYASATASGSSSLSATSNNNITDNVTVLTSSSASAQWILSFMILCPGGGCGATTPVSFSAELAGSYWLSTSGGGQYADSSVFSDLRVSNNVNFQDENDGGAAGTMTEQLDSYENGNLVFSNESMMPVAFADTLSGVFNAEYGQQYYALFYLDSFSNAENAEIEAVPEPATMTLVGLGLGAAFEARRRKRKNAAPAAV